MDLFQLAARVGLNTDDYKAGVKDVRNSGKKLAADFGKGLKNAAKAMADATKKLAIAGTTAITTLGVVGLKYNAQMESYTTNFKVMLGGTEKAVKKVESLKKMAAKTPFEMSDLADATQTLLAFNVANEDTEEVLTKLGDISLGNAQKLESLTRAYGKMHSSQKVTLEDINIMIDAGFNPLLGIAAKTGETMEELYGRISKGSVGFEELQEAIEKATSKGGQFYKGMEEASKTTTGLLSTLKDNAQTLIGKVFEPISESLTTNVLPSAIAAIENLTKAFEEKGITGMIQAAGEMVHGFFDKLLGGQSMEEMGASAMQFIQSLVSKISEHFPAVFGKALDLVTGFVKGMVDSLNAEAVFSDIQNLVLGIGEAIARNAQSLAESATTLILELGDGLIKAVSDPEAIQKFLQVGYDIASGIFKGIVDGLSKFVTEGLLGNSPLFDMTFTAGGIGWQSAPPRAAGSGSNSSGSFPSKGNVINSIISKPKPKPSGGGLFGGIRDFVNKAKRHASGLSYVPYDEYPALLHEGEMVLTKQQAAQYNNSSYGDIIVNVQGARYDDEQSLAAAIAEEIQTQIDRKRAAYA